MGGHRRSRLQPRCRTKRTSSQEPTVAQFGVALRMLFAHPPHGRVSLAPLDRGEKLWRHPPLILQSLLQPLLRFLRLADGKARQGRLGFSDCAHMRQATQHLARLKRQE